MASSLENESNSNVPKSPGNANSTGNRESLRLIAFGDCNTNSSDPEQGLLPVGLTAALASKNINVAVTNLGAGMTTTREGVAYLRDRGHAAELAILNFGLVDCWTTTIPGFYIPYCHPETRIRKLARKVLKFTKRYLRMQPFKAFVPMGPVVPPDEYQENIRSIIAMLRQWNPRITIFLWGTVPVADNLNRNESIAEYNNLLSQIARQDSVFYIDSAAILADLAVADRFTDGVHLSPQAASLIGQRISDSFLQQSRNNAPTAA